MTALISFAQMMMIPENVIAKNSFYTLLTKIFPKHPNHDLDVKQAGKKNPSVAHCPKVTVFHVRGLVH